MTYMVNNSLDWNKIELDLYTSCGSLRYSRDLRKMIKNIEKDVKLLSIEEVKARANRSNKVEEIKAKVNEDIDIVREYILIGKLLG